MPNRNFYQEIPVLQSFSDITELSNYQHLPDDWYVGISDVRGSTKAIEAGKYKDVNMLGASSIMGILNVAKPTIVPFVFGGDGATVCFPAYMLDAVKKAFIGTQKVAKESFNMDLRVGIVPIEAIKNGGHDVLVSRYQASKNYIQAVFNGGGLQYADSLIKDESLGDKYCLSAENIKAEVDFTGLECRWDQVPSKYDESVSLLIQVINKDETIRSSLYKQIIEKIDIIYDGEESYNPVNENLLELSLDKNDLLAETKTRQSGKSGWQQVWYLFFIRIQVIVGKILMSTGITLAGVHWGNYKKTVAANTDYKKFDDMLRQILSGTVAQRKQLEIYLEALHQQGDVIYGMHASPSVLMTCLVFERENQHMHFVDGSNGGYAMAAKTMKQQIANKVN